jgi:hypothetical protein
MSEEKNCWVMRDENGKIICVGESSGGIPPQIADADRYNINDPEIVSFKEALKSINNRLINFYGSN